MAAIILKALPTPPGWLSSKHVEWLAVLMLIVGLAALYAWMMELFDTFYGGGRALQGLQAELGGSSASRHWVALGLTFIPLQAMWVQRLRRTRAVVMLVAVCIVTGTVLMPKMLVASLP
jgi:hypothetical protein